MSSFRGNSSTSRCSGPWYHDPLTDMSRHDNKHSSRINNSLITKTFWSGDWWRLRLVQFVFRALALRDEFLALNDLHQMHGNYNNEWSRKKMIEIAMTWTTKYRVHGAATSERTRSVLRLVWQHWFGSKDFALLVAAEGVMDWKKIVASLSHLLQTEE